ncbi:MULTISPECIES: ABC-three component system middle component 1 [Flavobacterium]|uniref:ABC-three component system middle component 1 n=1 Tax=Flavobacterium TaxID=237 RepID=UPI0006F6E5D3|nr:MULTISPECIES: ABC-three component system middle component 1 [Flavobacterium]KRB53741.1 hypothetical protein ASD98_22410 [Flavobacterium sp. Root186]
MQLVKSRQTIEELSKFDDFFNTSGTECWQKPSGSINLYVFSIIYETAAELEKKYKELRDHIAVSFQSKRDSHAERWNLYLLYLVKEDVPEELKQIILQDKFSARKMVCRIENNQINDDYIKSLIGKTLIDIEIPLRQVSTDQLEQVINANHPEVAQAIQAIGTMTNRDNLQNLINILTDEQN